MKISSTLEKMEASTRVQKNSPLCLIILNGETFKGVLIEQ
mgnify:CR=1 FL=1